MGMYLMNDMNMSRYQLEAKVRQQAKGIWGPSTYYLTYTQYCNP